MGIRFAVLGFVCAGIGAASLMAWASEPQPPAAESVELATLMHAKLASSQKITEGLVTKDFDLIRKGAAEWQRVTAATKWYSHNDPVFLQYRAELGRNAEKLTRAADNLRDRFGFDSVKFGGSLRPDGSKRDRDES